MQAARHAARTPFERALVALLPATLFVGIALAACTVPPGELTTNTDKNATDPACRPSTCVTLGKNCGIVADGCGGAMRCGTCSGTGNDCRDNVCESGCRNNSECPSGAQCINGSCSDRCASSADCPSGQQCSNGSCIANPATPCTIDSQCRADERCLNNLCIGNVPGVGGACRYDSECRGGEACRNLRCTPLGGRTCTYHTDCPTNESCNYGYCSQQQQGKTCRANNECATNERCEFGSCRRYQTGLVVKAQCVTRAISIPLPFGQINVHEEDWFYDAQFPNGTRVDSCNCENTTLRADMGAADRTILCSRCSKDGSQRTCYE